MLLEVQNKILNLSPALYPLATFPLSFVLSWHCTVMCSPYLAPKTPAQRNLYLQGRTISYGLAGALFGGVGEGLRKLLEVKALGALAFFVFAALTLSLASVWLGLRQKAWHLPNLNFLNQYFKSGRAPSFVQGILSVALPCGLLYQILSLSALSHSVWGGALIGVVHATASSPALWSGTWIATRLAQSKSWLKYFSYAAVGALMVFNLLYFAGILLHSEEGAKSKLLFCF